MHFASDTRNTDLPAYDKSGSLRALLEISGIQFFLGNPKYTEIAINRPFEIWTESSSEGWLKHNAQSLSLAMLQQIANTFAIFNKLEINKDNPICSGVFPDGQRGQVVIPSVCERDTVSISIRRASDLRFSLVDYENSGRLADWIDNSEFIPNNTVIPNDMKSKFDAENKRISELNKILGIPEDVNLKLFELEMLNAKAERDINKFIKLAVENKQNIVLIGATGSGKTTFTKAVCDLFPYDKRIITIEDTPELDLPYHQNRVHLFYKDIPVKLLLRSCMRMKPDHIFLTELRGDEAYDYIQALNTGHNGSVTTVHANDCQTAYYRIGNLIQQSEVGKQQSIEKTMKDVYSTLDVMMFFKKTYLKEIAYDPIRKYKILKGKMI